MKPKRTLVVRTIIDMVVTIDVDTPHNYAPVCASMQQAKRMNFIKNIEFSDAVADHTLRKNTHGERWGLCYGEDRYWKTEISQSSWSREEEIHYYEEPPKIKSIKQNSSLYLMNKATISDFLKVKGIGQKVAQQLVEQRDELDGWRNLSEICVHGLSDAKLERIREYFVDAYFWDSHDEDDNQDLLHNRAMALLREAKSEDLEQIKGIGKTTIQKLLPHRNLLSSGLSWEKSQRIFTHLLEQI